MLIKCGRHTHPTYHAGIEEVRTCGTGLHVVPLTRDGDTIVTQHPDGYQITQRMINEEVARTERAAQAQRPFAQTRQRIIGVNASTNEYA